MRAAMVTATAYLIAAGVCYALTDEASVRARSGDSDLAGAIVAGLLITWLAIAAVRARA